jgi:hypothetical protein
VVSVADGDRARTPAFLVPALVVLIVATVKLWDERT